MFMKKIFENPDILKWVIIGLAGFVALILVFGAGVKVGALKARYSYKWAESYHKNFGGPRGGFFGDWRQFPAGDFISGHGAFREIIKEGLKVGDRAVIIGSPNEEGQIEAKMIRIMKYK